MTEHSMARPGWVRLVPAGVAGQRRGAFQLGWARRGKFWLARRSRASRVQARLCPARLVPAGRAGQGIAEFGAAPSGMAPPARSGRALHGIASLRLVRAQHCSALLSSAGLARHGAFRARRIQPLARRGDDLPVRTRLARHGKSSSWLLLVQAGPARLGEASRDESIRGVPVARHVLAGKVRRGTARTRQSVVGRGRAWRDAAFHGEARRGKAGTAGRGRFKLRRRLGGQRGSRHGRARSGGAARGRLGLSPGGGSRRVEAWHGTAGEAWPILAWFGVAERGRAGASWRVSAELRAAGAGRGEAGAARQRVAV
jgi:hypothetical protein